MATTHLANSLLFSFVTFIFFNLMIVEAKNGGFSIELVHRDSPISPFYNSTETDSDRLRKAVHRSMSRISYFTSSSSLSPTSIESNIISSGFEYLMKLSIGTPPIEILAIADTGSDLTWTQCKPCVECYSQDAPLFNPQQSSTYRELSCESQPCRYLPDAQCGNKSSECEYSYSYGDQSFTNGALATETFTFDSTSGRPVTIPKLAFGCGHNNGGTFSGHESGLVGLGGGPLSLVSQLGSKIDGKFSYCLTPSSNNSTSKLNFGSHAVISDEGVVSTPLVRKEPDTFYYLTLESISVGDKKVNNQSSAFNQSEGNIIIDSGTTLTMLEASLFSKLETVIKEAIGHESVEDPSRTFSLCYNTNVDIKLPEITFHFTGSDLVLKPLNTFVQASDALMCLSIIPSQSFSILGNLAQMNFQIEYDLIEKKVSFAPANCTEH